jgi:hypothetical protein
MCHAANPVPTASHDSRVMLIRASHSILHDPSPYCRGYGSIAGLAKSFTGDASAQNSLR